MESNSTTTTSTTTTKSATKGQPGKRQIHRKLRQYVGQLHHWQLGQQSQPAVAVVVGSCGYIRQETEFFEEKEQLPPFFGIGCHE